jgi:hypothetical protein
MTTNFRKKIAILQGPTRLDVNFVKFQPRLDGDFFPAPYPVLFQRAPPKPTVAGFNQLEALVYSRLCFKNYFVINL